LYNLEPKETYKELAHKIADLMPEHGMDKQRTGWYDVVDRVTAPGQKFHRFAWHDRKAWWQQEQGILAYLIMNGTYNEAEYLKYARESSSFYNAWFLDHDSGAIYFNTLANGLPYLLGTEREKGSHSMSGYHSFELCYLASVYSNLLITKQGMNFYFKPYPNNLKDNVLRVAPDLLPEGSIKIESVTIDGLQYDNFDAEGLTVNLPETNERVKVCVRIVPTVGLGHFAASTNFDNSGNAVIKLQGDLDVTAVHHFRKELSKVYSAQSLTIDLSELNSTVTEGIRAIVFARQKMKIDEKVVITGANDDVRAIFELEEFSEEVTVQ
jgi:anti-anti-sigma factor